MLWCKFIERAENVPQLLGYVDTYLKCVGAFLIPLTVVNLYRNGIQGMGFGLLPMLAGVAELVGRGSASLIAAHYRSYLGICMGGPLAWVLSPSRQNVTPRPRKRTRTAGVLSLIHI